MGELMIAYGAFNLANYKKAIESFNASLKLDYNQEKTHMLLGYTFKQLGKEEYAVNCFRNSINVNPDFYEAYVQLGQIFHLRKDTLAAVYYANALRINPADELTLYNKALFYQDMEQWNKALDAYAELHKVDPFHSSGHYNLGFIHMELGLYDVATNNFSDAIYSASEFYEAYYSRGNCFETLGNIAQAESDYKRAIEINPQYTYAIEALESLRENNKKYNK
jgi:tetratricopeptide (TPR) repeat protein